ncbi:MAG: tRNA 5-methoxyuridine(34)/uridine 5-oxyacetic acid(34) synthase CmoB [Bdellovibrionota bacterium]
MPTEDYLNTYRSQIRADAIQSLREKNEGKKTAENLAIYRHALSTLHNFKTNNIDLEKNAITIGTLDELSTQQQKTLNEALTTFIPWKKGPFNLFGQYIDSEWRSDLKWERIKNYIGHLKDQKIADIGCNNGYFMFRMAPEQPEIVIGFEPYAKHWFAYNLIQRLGNVPNIYFEIFGTEYIDLYPKFFDKVFCLGILYHQTDPIATLRKIYESLSNNGEIIIDCQGIEGSEPIALVPSGRYAQARGIWYLPTKACLENWLRRTKFRQIECFYDEKLSTDEQRTTPWAPIKSLKDFLDPNDINKTIEGYPAPRRFYFSAKR